MKGGNDIEIRKREKILLVMFLSIFGLYYFQKYIKPKEYQTLEICNANIIEKLLNFNLSTFLSTGFI